MPEVLELAFNFIEGYTQDQNTQIKLYTILYNVFRPTERYRYDVFMRLLQFWEHNKCADVIKNNLESIDEITKKWDISIHERIEMYKKAIDLFVASDEKLAAYQLLIKTLKLLGDDTELIMANQFLVTQAITIGLQHPKVAQFDVLYNLPAVKAQKEAKTNEKLFELLHIFTFEDLAEYTKWESNNKQFLESQNIESNVCRHKMMYLSFCSQAMKDNVISYDNLAKIMGVNRDEIEDWVIDAIVNKIIDARLDQDNESIVINSFTQRNMDKAEWENLKGKLDKTKDDFQVVLQLIRPK